MGTRALPPSSLPPAPLPFAVRQALQPSAAPAPGFAMVELLAIGAASAMLAVVAWSGYQRSAERRTVASEADSVAAIARNTARTYASRADFGDLTQSNALAQGLFPAGLITGNGAVANAWGGAVNLAAVSTDGGVTKNGFTITYSNVPSSACVGLATSAAGFAEVTVRNANAGSRTPAGVAPPFPIPDAIEPPGVPGLHDGSVLSTMQASRVDPALAASRCANSLNSVAFTYLTAAVARTSCVGSGPVPPVYATQGASCPMGSKGLPQLVADDGPDQYQSAWTQTHQRDGACNASGTIDYGPWSPWLPTYSCADQCVQVSTTSTASQIYTCPGTGLITTPGPSQYQHQGPQSQTIATSQTCTTPIGPLSTPPTVSSTGWSPVYACAPACVLPSPSTQTQCAGTPQSVACPAGMTVGAHTFQLINTRSATCAAPTGSATWGAWATTTTRCNESNTCASSPPPSCTWPAAPPPSTTPACSGGGNQTGGTWQHAACPNWTYVGGACPPSPPSCTWPAAPSTSPACASGGNQTGGTWVHAATCPNWSYSGGVCAPPPAPSVLGMCNGRLTTHCFIMHTVPLGPPPAPWWPSYIFLLGDDCDASGPYCRFTNPALWSIQWSGSPYCTGGGDGTHNACRLTQQGAGGGCNGISPVVNAVITYVPTGATITKAFQGSCEINHL